MPTPVEIARMPAEALDKITRAIHGNENMRGCEEFYRGYNVGLNHATKIALPASDAARAFPAVVEALQEAADHFDRIADKALHWMQVCQKNETAEARWSQVKNHAAHRATEARAALVLLKVTAAP